MVSLATSPGVFGSLASQTQPTSVRIAFSITHREGRDICIEIDLGTCRWKTPWFHWGALTTHHSADWGSYQSLPVRDTESDPCWGWLGLAGADVHTISMWVSTAGTACTWNQNTTRIQRLHVPGSNTGEAGTCLQVSSRGWNRYVCIDKSK